MAIGWLLLSLLYLVGLFWVARWGDSQSKLAKKLTSHPATYALALGIYCTAWTFFGAVGEASRNNWQYLPIMLGPFLVYVFGYRFLVKMVLVSKKQRITTISDFISSRYGKRQTVAMLVTIIALLATIPYVALQLKAIGLAFQLVTEQQGSETVVLFATLFIAIFAIYFGTKNADITEYRRGLMLAIAFESTVKIIAIVVIATVAYFMWQSQQTGPFLATFTHEKSLKTFQTFPFIAQTIMAAAAVICLPRQFHVAVVDNLKPDHLKTARWLFPSYLAVMAVVIPIIAAAGNGLFAGATVEPDSYVLNLAIMSGSSVVKVLVFVGGLSAATAMIIVATMTLSTMLTNDVILPRILLLKNIETRAANFTPMIIIIRRVVIAILLLLSYVYYQQMTNSRSLASIGLIAFSLVIQLLPAIVIGLYWKKGHAHGVYAGLIAGLFTWILWLILPILGGAENVALQTETLSQGAMLSLAANCIAYFLFSHFAPTRLVDRIQAQAFVEEQQDLVEQNKKAALNVTTADLTTVLSTFLGDKRSAALVNDFAQKTESLLTPNSAPNQEFIAFCERALGGVLGSSSSKVLIDSVVGNKKLDFEEVVNFFDDSTQAIKFNSSALFTSIESLDQGISVVDKELRLVAWNNRYLSLFDYPKELISVGTPIENLVRFNAEKGECGVGKVDELVNKRLVHMRNGHSHRFIRQRSDGRMIEMVGNPLPGGGFVTSFSDITAHIEAQEALKESNIDLTNRVKQRGDEVQAINAELHLEIERRAQLEEELMQAKLAAEEANASKTRFLALASHDVLQPLNAAKLYLSALKEMPLATDVSQTVSKLSDSVASSETLIATLLDIARLDQGELAPEIKEVSLKALFSPLVEEFKMAAEQKCLLFKFRIDDLWVSTDSTYLYRIIQNFISNAVKYSEKGKVLFTVRKVAGMARIEVRDTGIGISQTELARIFSDFYRVQGSNQHGVGLGLGVVKRLSDQLKTPITINSSLGKGSCFGISIPLLQQAPIQIGVATTKVAKLEGLRALCVDDKQENLDALSTLLTKWQVECHLATNVEQAQQLFSEVLPNILLIDYQLGGEVNGLALIRQLRRQSNQYIPATLVTANREKSLLSECETDKVTYLSKPIKPAKLRSLLNGYVTQIDSKM